MYTPCLTVAAGLFDDMVMVVVQASGLLIVNRLKTTSLHLVGFDAFQRYRPSSDSVSHAKIVVGCPYLLLHLDFVI
jgi:hypothetical protein